MDNLQNNAKDELMLLWNKLNSSLLFGDKKYFHLQSVQNMILFFDEIKQDADRNWIYETLVSFFQEADRHSNSINRNISNSLYSTYLDKLTEVYRRDLGFAVLVNRLLVYFVYLLLLALAYIFLNTITTIVLGSLFLVITYRVYLKYKDHKVYGLYF